MKKLWLLPLRLAYLFKSVKGEILLPSEFEKNLFKVIPGGRRVQTGGAANDKEYTFQEVICKQMDEDAEGNLWVVSKI